MSHNFVLIIGTVQAAKLASIGMRTELSDSAGVVTVAPHPFDDKQASADVILRTSDGVDFYTHKLILSLASPFFADMFSLPQPSSDSESSPLRGADSIPPVIDVAEESMTIDCLLRFCYPVRDPAMLSMEVLDRVLGAAVKYDLAEAVELVHDKLRQLVSSKPLDVFAISCHRNKEEIAMLAAKSSASPSVGVCKRCRSGAVSRPSTFWPTDRFGATFVAKHYCPLMEGRISAACFYRFLRFLNDRKPTTFIHSPALTESALPHTILAERLDLLVKDYPFNHRDADVVLRSSDEHCFRVHRIILELNMEGGSIGSLESASNFSGEHSTTADLPCISTKENGRTLAVILRTCYPARDTRPISDWDIDELCDGNTVRALQAAKEHGFISVQQAYQARMRQLAVLHPLRVYCITASLGYWSEAAVAAKQLTFFDLPSMYCSEMESLPVQHYYRLLEYHHHCLVAMRSVVRNHCPNMDISWLESYRPGSLETLVLTALWKSQPLQVQDNHGWGSLPDLNLDTKKDVEHAIEAALQSVSGSAMYNIETILTQKQTDRAYNLTRDCTLYQKGAVPVKGSAL